MGGSFQYPTSEENKKPKNEGTTIDVDVKKTLLIATPVVLLCGWFAYDYLATNLKFIPTSEEERAAIRAEVAKQTRPHFTNLLSAQREVAPANPLNNVYFGDLHIHSSLSADAYLFGNRRDLDDTYRFAKGESATLRAVKSLKSLDP